MTQRSLIITTKLASFLDHEGIWIPGKRFAFTNISDKPFNSKWNGVPIVIDSGETIEVSDITPFPGSGMGHCLSVKMAKELTDQIMFGNAKADEVQKNIPFYRSPLGTMVSVPTARKPFEDKILQELESEQEIGKLTILKKQKMEELQNDASKKEGISYEQSSGQEFVEIPKGPQIEQRKPVKAAARTKKIK